ncbi:MAG: SWIM zinc finger family protein [Chloroflexota bacterium]|nr:SWIM zinc finger family protein [Chloroflexota bacterium]
MVQTTNRRPARRATHERWQAALQRALAEGIQVRQLAGSGAWVASSGTDTTAAYLVSANGCECQAGEYGDPICKHRAAYWHALGALDLDPKPAAAARPAPATIATCPGCGGNGIDRACHGHRIASGYVVHCPCPTCDGAGTVAVDVVIAERPAA